MTVPDTASGGRADIATAPRVVVKVGSSSLTTPDGDIDGDRIGALAAAQRPGSSGSSTPR